MQTLRLKFVPLLMVAGVLSISLVWWMGTHKTLEDAHNRSTDSELVHGNDDRNNRLHIVYEIFAVSPAGKSFTLKYGISGQNNFITKYGNPRPEYQVPYYQNMTKYKDVQISYKILRENIPGRVEAKKIERELINKYFSRYGYQPPEQLRPVPEMLKQLKKVINGK